MIRISDTYFGQELIARFIRHCSRGDLGVRRLSRAGFMRAANRRRIRLPWCSLFAIREVCPGSKHRRKSTCGDFSHAGVALFDSLGAFVWAAGSAGLGYIFSDQLEQVAAYASHWGNRLVVALVGSLAAYVLWKYVQRQRFLHRLRIARITPQ